MSFIIIAPPVPTQKWKEELELIAPEIPLVIGADTDNQDDIICYGLETEAWSFKSF